MAIFDWDIHHGDGTASIFAKDPNVLYISTHRYDEKSFYPHKDESGPENVGEGEGKGFNVNIGFET